MGSYYLLFYSFTLFLISLFGLFFNFRNLITMLMCIEMMILSINIVIITASIVHSDISLKLFVLFIITIAGAESAIGLAIIIAFYRLRGNINVVFKNLVKA